MMSAVGWRTCEGVGVGLLVLLGNRLALRGLGDGVGAVPILDRHNLTHLDAVARR